jgi:hypothetical protein
MAGQQPPGFYDPRNTYFPSPDAEILYMLIRFLRPGRVIEVGSGNSTRIVRQAIHDGNIECLHVSIDPEPRSDIAGMVDKIHLSRLEDIHGDDIFEDLRGGDVLFIDSSHMIHAGNDVVKLFCDVIPRLPTGVYVHVHDVFLPYDYPAPFHDRSYGWGEQYLLAALLCGSEAEIIWPGYYAQQQRPDIRRSLPFLENGRAQSFWFRT